MSHLLIQWARLRNTESMATSRGWFVSQNLMVQERVWEKMSGNSIPRMSLYFAFRTPKVWLEYGVIHHTLEERGGEDAIGNKTLNQTWVSEIRSQRGFVWSTRTQYKWLHVLYGLENVFFTSKISKASTSSYFTLRPISPPPTKMHHSYSIIY